MMPQRFGSNRIGNVLVGTHENGKARTSQDHERSARILFLLFFL